MTAFIEGCYFVLYCSLRGMALHPANYSCGHFTLLIGCYRCIGTPEQPLKYVYVVNRRGFGEDLRCLKIVDFQMGMQFGTMQLFW